MGPLILGALAGAGLGLLKGEADKKREKKERLLNAEIVRYSPWTRLNPEPVQSADPMGSILQGGLSGAMMGQGIAGVNAQNAALSAQGAAAAPGAAPPPTYMPGQGMAPYANASPWTGMSPAPGYYYPFGG